VSEKCLAEKYPSKKHCQSVQRSTADTGHRKLLTIATSAIASVGFVAAAIPFISYWKPSAKAQAFGAPVSINFNKLEPGQMITASWQGKPVWVLRRTEQNIERLKMNIHREMLREPNSEVDHQVKLHSYV